MPVESNDTPQGRQQNRRVELIVSGQVIGTQIGAAKESSRARGLFLTFAVGEMSPERFQAYPRGRKTLRFALSPKGGLNSPRLDCNSRKRASAHPR